MISRREFTCAALGVIVLPLAAQAQPAGKVYRIGWLAPAPSPSHLDAFRGGMRGLGYVEGTNLEIAQRYANQREQLAGLAAELISANVDVLVTTANMATKAAQDAAGSTPVVFVSGNPVG